ncbi:MAG: hypothetical protein KF908_07705 [Nitrosomonas sp.]|nr:hypothetical protein [Nitrosomonas sp.]MCW5607165.1 hypothetical protein [Nitrosomonas sp.]
MKTRYAVKAQTTRLIKCKVKVTTRTGETHFYYGLFRSTSDAVLDAVSRFETTSIQATAA